MIREMTVRNETRMNTWRRNRKAREQRKLHQQTRNVRQAMRDANIYRIGRNGGLSKRQVAMRIARRVHNKKEHRSYESRFRKSCPGEIRAFFKSIDRDVLIPSSVRQFFTYFDDDDLSMPGAVLVDLAQGYIDEGLSDDEILVKLEEYARRTKVMGLTT